MKNTEPHFGHAREAIIIFLALMIAMMLLPPAIIGGKTDSVGLFIFNYQTLLTGALAVAAAFATVRKMGQLDRMQAVRHQQTVDLAVRSDKMRLERAINPQLDDLKAAAEDLGRVSLNREPFAGMPGDPRYHFLTAVASGYVKPVGNLIEIFSRKQFVDGAALFDGKLTRKLDIITDSLPQVRGALTSHLHQVSGPVTGNETHYYQEDFDNFIVPLLIQIDNVPAVLEEVIAEIARTKQENGI